MRFLFALLVTFTAGSACAAPRLDEIKLPPGFRISVYADNVGAARSLALGERGTLFVGSSQGNVYAVPPGGGAARIIARGLNAPHGVAFHEGALYVAEMGRITRYDAIESRLQDPPKPEVVSADLPHHPHHGYKPIRFGPDGLLYVGIGSPCNVCEPQGEDRAIVG